DTHPEGSSKGTVVFTNGAPGSHKDFKYVTPMLAEDGIRVIGINYPGMGYTPYDSRLRETSDERLQFVQGILDAVDVKDNIVFAGHSRGSEDALKLGLLNKNGTEGVVLINPVGLRPHRGISPYPLLLWWSWQWKVMTGPLQFMVNPFYKFLYDLYKVSVDSGEMAGMCLNLMANTDYPGQREFIEQLNESDLNVLLACAGKDHLIEPEITRELLSAFTGLKEMTCTAQGQDAEITARTTNELRSGTKRLGVYFTEDGHHLQKHRPHFIYKSITAIFDAKRNQ
ncbi:Protein Y73C8B.3, partial [Aphelenchoides avenae]